MVSVALGVFIIFIVYIMIWSIRNEDARSISEQTGFLKMRDPSNSAHKRSARPGQDRQAAAHRSGRQRNQRQ